MPYISELLDNRITDSSDASVGKLEDILITLPKEGVFEPLEFLAVRGFNNHISYVPFEQVTNFTSSQITLKGQFGKVAIGELPKETYIGLKKDVLDKQIVDIADTRVVRVNDLRIGVLDNKMSVLAIDASFRGLLRRLGLEGSFWNKIFKVNLIDWRQAQLVESSGPVRLNDAAENLSQLHPADIANIVEDLDVKKGSNLLASLDSAEAARVLEEVNPELQTILVKHLGPERAGKILGHMSSDELVDLVKTFSSGDAKDFLAQISGGGAQKVSKLINYPDDTAGGLMTLDFASSRPDWSLSRVIEELRTISPNIRSIVHVYVTDESGKFLGAVSLRRILLADKEEVMGKIAKDFPDYSTLKPNDKIRKVIKLMTKYNLYTAAVVDKDKKLLGVVTIDDVMRSLAPLS